MMSNRKEAEFRRYQLGPLTPSERAAHSIGMQNWHRQFQPSFSPDPMVVKEFEQGFNPLRSMPENVRGPMARFAPGGRDFQAYWNEAPPRRAFYQDNIFGGAQPIPFDNRWESNYAARQRQMLPFTLALAKKLNNS